MICGCIFLFLIKKMRATKILVLLLFVIPSAMAQDAPTAYNEGLVLKKEKNTRAALEKFKQASGLRADYIEALYEMGWCYNELKDYTNSLATFRKVLPFWPPIPKVHFETGYAFEKQNQYDSALFYYNRCITLKPDYALAYKQLAYIAYTKSGDNAIVLQAFEKYESIETKEIKDYLFWYRKGFTQNALQDYAGAKTSLDKSLLLKQDYTNTFLELGFACNKLKQAEDAIDFYKRAIALEPTSHIGYNGIAEVYRDTKKDIEEAMTWYKKTLELNANERKAHYGMGYCFNSKEQYSNAIMHLKKAIAAETTYTAAYVELGYSYFKTNDYTQAETNLKKALQLNDKNENARYYMGLMYISQGNKARAQQMVTELKALQSKNAASLQGKVDQMN